MKKIFKKFKYLKLRYGARIFNLIIYHYKIVKLFESSTTPEKFYLSLIIEIIYRFRRHLISIET